MNRRATRTLCVLLTLCGISRALPAQRLEDARRGISRIESITTSAIASPQAYTSCATRRGQAMALGGLIGGVLGFGLGSVLGGLADTPSQENSARTQIALVGIGIGVGLGLIAASRSAYCD